MVGFGMGKNRKPNGRQQPPKLPAIIDEPYPEVGKQVPDTYGNKRQEPYQVNLDQMSEHMADQMREHLANDPVTQIAISVNSLKYGEMVEISEFFMQTAKHCCADMPPTITAEHIAKILHCLAVERLKQAGIIE